MREVGICLAPSVRTPSSLAVINAAGELLDLDDARSDREIAQWMTRWASRHCQVAITPGLLWSVPSITVPAGGAVDGDGDEAIDGATAEVMDGLYADRVQRLVQLLELDPTPGSAALRRIVPLPADGDGTPSSAPPSRPLGAAAGPAPAMAGMVSYLESLQDQDVPLYVSGSGKWASLRLACLAPGRTAQAEQLRFGLEAVASAYLARVLRLQPDVAPAAVRAWREQAHRGASSHRPAREGGTGRRARGPLLVLEIEGLPDLADPGRAGRWREAVARAVSARPPLAPQIRVGMSLTFRMPPGDGASDLDQLLTCALQALAGSTGMPAHQAGARGEQILVREQVDAVEARRRPVRGDERPGLTVQIFDLGSAPR